MKMNNAKKPICRSISPFPESMNFSLTPKCSGGLVMIAQIVLGELKVFYDALPYLPVSGNYNGDTAEAVRIFQKISHLPQTGEINLETWNRMAEEYDMVNRMN